jgi:hypothetical protein
VVLLDVFIAVGAAIVAGIVYQFTHVAGEKMSGGRVAIATLIFIFVVIPMALIAMVA